MKFTNQANNPDAPILARNINLMSYDFQKFLWKKKVRLLLARPRLV